MTDREGEGGREEEIYWGMYNTIWISMDAVCCEADGWRLSDTKESFLHSGTASDTTTSEWLWIGQSMMAPIRAK